MNYMVLTETVNSLNTQWVTDFMSLVKTVIGVCSEFPLNILLTASLAAAAVGVFGRIKNALTS